MIPVGAASAHGNELAYVTDAVEQGWFSAGPYVARFEAAFARYVGVEHAVAVSSGTAALHLALLIMGVGPGDEVIVPSLTFVATANAVRYCGATPVFVDVDPDTWTMDVAAMRAAITERTRAVIPVHLFGNPANMLGIVAEAKSKGLFVIGDAAEALGATLYAKDVSTYGHVACHSFYGNKTITTGEGGMVVSNSSAVAHYARHLRGQAQTERRYWHDEVGYNYRMTNLQGALGLAQVEQLPRILTRRAVVWEIYQRLLDRDLQMQVDLNDHAVHGHWMLAVAVPDDVDRDALADLLHRAGVETRPVFPPVHTMPMYATGQHLPVTDDLARRGLVLPTHAELSDEDVFYVTQAVNESIGSARRSHAFPVAQRRGAEPGTADRSSAGQNLRGAALDLDRGRLQRFNRGGPARPR